MKGVSKFKRPVRNSIKNTTSTGIVRLKAHAKRGKLRAYYRATTAANNALASQINVKKLMDEGKITYLEVDDNGVAQVDYDNPVHQRWLED